MHAIVEFLKKLEGAKFVNEDGLEDRFQRRPPLSEEELRTFESSLPCRITEEMQELLQFSRGFDGVLSDGIDFAGVRFGLEGAFPHARELASDGFGNFWVVDMTSDSTSFGPIFYACHDAPVIVYQTDSLLHFLKEVVRFVNRPWKSEIDDVHEKFTTRIWRDNPCIKSFAECVANGDVELKTFAESLDDSWEFADLRYPKLRDGYSGGGMARKR